MAEPGWGRSCSVMVVVGAIAVIGVAPLLKNHWPIRLAPFLEVLASDGIWRRFVATVLMVVIAMTVLGCDCQPSRLEDALYCGTFHPNQVSSFRVS